MEPSIGVPFICSCTTNSGKVLPDANSRVLSDAASSRCAQDPVQLLATLFSHSFAPLFILRKVSFIFLPFRTTSGLRIVLGECIGGVPAERLHQLLAVDSLAGTTNKKSCF